MFIAELCLILALSGGFPDCKSGVGVSFLMFIPEVLESFTVFAGRLLTSLSFLSHLACFCTWLLRRKLLWILLVCHRDSSNQV